MKNTCLFNAVLAAAIAVALCACAKVGISLFQGEYSFKSSGSIEVQGEDCNYTLKTANEIGQIHINQAYDGTVKVSMNVIGGGVTVFDARVSDTAIILVSRTRTVHLSPELGPDFLTGFDAELTMGGIGRKSGKDIIFDFEYSGKVDALLIKGTVTRSSVECVASRNE